MKEFVINNELFNKKNIKLWEEMNKQSLINHKIFYDINLNEI
jgi:hypothetical protein